MRLVSFAAALVLTSAVAAAQSTGNATTTKPKKTPTSLPAPKAEPANPDAYAAPAKRPGAGPSGADVGPVQSHFVRASTLDDLAQTETEDNATIAATQAHEKRAIDQRITVPVIHDVQNDGLASGGDNAALRYEITYLNWGAITNEQLLARRGHYFTITWKNGGPQDNFVARFQYREVKSQEVVRTLTQEMPQVSGAVRSYFAVTDRAYLAYGPVVSWRFTVLKGDTIVAEAKSFIW